MAKFKFAYYPGIVMDITIEAATHDEAEARIECYEVSLPWEAPENGCSADGSGNGGITMDRYKLYEPEWDDQ